MQSNPVDNADFEIAFAALLATAISQSETPYIQYPNLVEWMAISLLFLTLIRRIGVVNQLDKEKFLFIYSNYLMKLVSLVCLVYIIFSLSYLIHSYFGIWNSMSIFWIIAIPIAVMAPVFQEIFLGGGYMIEAQRAFSEAAEANKGTFGGKIWSQLGLISKPAEEMKENSGTQLEIDDFYCKENTSQRGEIPTKLLRRTALHIVATIVGLLLPFVLYGLVALAVSIHLEISIYVGLWTGLCVLSLTGLTDIWFSRYGLIKVNQTNWVGKAVSTMFALAFCMLMLPL